MANTSKYTRQQKINYQKLSPRKKKRSAEMLYSSMFQNIKKLIWKEENNKI